MFAVESFLTSQRAPSQKQAGWKRTKLWLGECLQHKTASDSQTMSLWLLLLLPSAKKKKKRQSKAKPNDPSTET